MDNIDKVLLLSKEFNKLINLDFTPCEIQNINDYNDKIDGSSYVDIDYKILMQITFVKTFGRLVNRNIEDSTMVNLALQLSKFNKYKL